MSDYKYIYSISSKAKIGATGCALLLFLEYIRN
jgi:hypothetical protein